MLKRILVLLIATMVLLVLFAPPALSAQDQERQKITVKSREVNNGVVILSVQDGKGSFELQCNKNMNWCAVLEPGEYQMVRLPKNWGLYDCANAEVYPKANGSETGEKLGAYCLVQSK
jgi:hypothetical protein